MGNNAFDPQYAGSVSPDAAGAALAVIGAMLLVFAVFFLVIYVYMAISLMKIAKKTNTPNGWFAWIPFLNMWLLVQIAQKEWWWFLLMLIPLVNIVVAVILWMEVSKAVGKPDWLGILIIVPVANFILPGYLAFSKDERQNAEPAKPAEPINPVQSSEGKADGNKVAEE